ncbi:MAG TPA: hypothetical protein VH601_19235 [Bryobacteraceae bacterium]|jgi:hypothetical protein
MNPAVVSKPRSQLGRVERKRAREAFERFLERERVLNGYPEFWVARSRNGRWRFADTDLSIRFETLIAKAGKLAGCPKDKNSAFFWLDLVKTFVTACNLRAPDRDFYWYGQSGNGMLRFPVDASIEYLRSFETKSTCRYRANVERLNQELKKRGWNIHDVERQVGQDWNGPNHKTVQKILNGKLVTEETAERTVKALNQAPGFPKLSRKDIFVG